MKAALAILAAKIRIAKHTVASVRFESKLKVAVVSVSAVVLWVGAFALFYGAMSWLDRQYDDALSGLGEFSIAQLIMTRLLAVFAMVLFFMLIFSNVLIVFSTAYRSKEVAYLIQAPMTSRTYFLARLAECIFISSWASAYLGSPLILAYGFVDGNALPILAAAAAFYVPFVTISAALGAIIAVIIVRLFPRIRTGSLVAAAALLAGGAYYAARTRISAERLSELPILDRVLDAARQTQSPYLPSYWAAQGVLSAGAGDYGETLFFGLLLLSTALFACWLAGEVAQQFFYMGWSDLTGQDRLRIFPMHRGLSGLAVRAGQLFREPIQSLLVKDIKLFWRDPAQWSQFVIFFGLMAFYVANLRPHSAAMDSPVWRGSISILNIAASALILATLTSRFVFPLVSLEGRRFWVLGLAPITIRQLMWQKFWLSVAVTSFFTVGLVLLSCVKLRVEPVPFALSMYSIVITNFALSGMAVGLGGLYPNFQEDNPARIVSGMGGTLNFLLSMAYIVLVVGAQGVILQWRVIGRFTSESGFSVALAAVLAFITILSLACWLLPMRLGLRNLQRMEF